MKNTNDLRPCELSTIRLVGIYTGGSFRLDRLTGPAKRSCRKHIVETLLGHKVPPALTGINAPSTCWTPSSASRGIAPGRSKTTSHSGRATSVPTPHHTMEEINAFESRQNQEAPR